MQENKDYHFPVTALGKVVVVRITYLYCECADVPLRNYTVTCTVSSCWNNTACRLQDTGGKPISHYIVEKKDKKSGKWTPVSKYCKTPECDVTGLDEGEEYEFRVAAVNDQGQSDPLVTLKPIIAKHPFGTCHCVLNQLHGDLWHIHFES